MLWTDQGIAANQSSSCGRDPEAQQYQPRPIPGAARLAGCEPDIVELDSPVSPLPIAAVVTALRRFWKLSALREPQEFAAFLRGRPVWSRFIQILSNELMFRQASRQLARWKVGKLVTMNEQWFPSNLLVAAANQLGIETHQILHGGMATEFYVPFQSKYTWP